VCVSVCIINFCQQDISEISL